MTDTKISQLPAGVAPSGTEQVPVVQSSQTVRLPTNGLVPQFTNTTPGTVPLSGGGTTNFLRADGTWAAPSSGPSAANPTATAGPNAINGVAATFMRSDAAPAIQLGSSSQPGLLQVDNTTITATAGVISAVAANASGTVPGIVAVDNKSIHLNANKIATGIQHPGFAAGRYYFPWTCSPAGAFAAFGSNVIRAMPFYVPFPTTFTRTAVKTNTASQHIEWGIWTTNNGVPDQLLYDFGSQATLANAVIELTGLTIALNAGTYALGCVTDGSVSQTYANTNAVDGVLGAPDTGSGINAAGWTGAFTYNAGNLPTTFPSPAFADSQTMPLVFLRLS